MSYCDDLRNPIAWSGRVLKAVDPRPNSPIDPPFPPLKVTRKPQRIDPPGPLNLQVSAEFSLFLDAPARQSLSCARQAQLSWFCQTRNSAPLRPSLPLTAATSWPRSEAVTQSGFGDSERSNLRAS